MIAGQWLGGADTYSWPSCPKQVEVTATQFRRLEKTETGTYFFVGLTVGDNAAWTHYR